MLRKSDRDLGNENICYEDTTPVIASISQTKTHLSNVVCLICLTTDSRG